MIKDIFKYLFVIQYIFHHVQHCVISWYILQMHIKKNKDFVVYGSTKLLAWKGIFDKKKWSSDIFTNTQAGKTSTSAFSNLQDLFILLIFCMHGCSSKAISRSCKLFSFEAAVVHKDATRLVNQEKLSGSYVQMQFKLAIDVPVMYLRHLRMWI